MINTNANENKFNILLYLFILFILFINKIFLLFRKELKNYIMTELDIAYSFNPNNHTNYQNFNTPNDKNDYDNNNNNDNDNHNNDINDDNDKNDNYKLPEKKERKEEHQQVQIQQPPMIIPSSSYNYNYNNNNNNYEERQAPVKKSQRNPEYSFWDRMVMSKNDVLKLIILSLIIVLGISIEKILFHYINQYLSENLLSPIQDFLVRISIPVSVILFLWIIKSL